MSKKLCERAKAGQLNDNPKYLCTKCGRVANKEPSLCNPIAFVISTGLLGRSS